jgi:hypothetical protein
MSNPVSPYSRNDSSVACHVPFAIAMVMDDCICDAPLFLMLAAVGSALLSASFDSVFKTGENSCHLGYHMLNHSK